MYKLICNEDNTISFNPPISFNTLNIVAKNIIIEDKSLGIDINLFENIKDIEKINIDGITFVKENENLEDIKYILYNGARCIDKQESKSILTKLKAFDIIKNKRVNVHLLLLSDDLRKYNFATLPHRKLTQEEFDLLKGTLKL